MKSLKIFAGAGAFLMCFAIASGSCSKGSDGDARNCSELSDKIDADKKDYNASPTKEKCMVVVGDYNEFINSNCDEDSSYENLLVAFKQAHNDCK